MDTRKLLTTCCMVIALVLEPLSIGWSFFLHSSGGPFGSFEGPTPLYYLTISIALLAGLVVFIAGRGRMRWLLLLIFLPCVGYLIGVTSDELTMRMHQR
jgi:hypothetical protein